MPQQLKKHIVKIWRKNCEEKGKEKEEKYDLHKDKVYLTLPGAPS